MLKRARTGVLLALSFALAAPGVVEAQGVLLLAHGGRDDWNREVLELASQVDSTLPVEVAFGMANKRTIQDAVERLAERDVTEIQERPPGGAAPGASWRTGGQPWNNGSSTGPCIS